MDESDGIKWNDSYLLGNELVDSQHMELFNLVNSLVNSCASGTDVIKLKNTLEFLVNYAVQHLDDEEALQLQYNYP
jgi:hemerythrin